MTTVKFRLHPANHPRLGEAEAQRLDAMTPEAVEANALSDADNPPLDAVELDRLGAARIAILARKATGMSQARFARAFRFSPGRLRDLEQGRGKRVDAALTAYLQVIRRDPAAVLRALKAEDRSAT